MKNTMTCYDFIDGMMKIRPENFSRAGLLALWDYFEEYEDGTDQQIEFDPIAICCEWSEYENEKEALENYGLETMEQLEDRTTVIKTSSDAIVLSAF